MVTLQPEYFNIPHVQNQSNKSNISLGNSPTPKSG